MGPGSCSVGSKPDTFNDMAETLSLSPISDSFILHGSEQISSLEPGNYEHQLPSDGSIHEFEHYIPSLVGLLNGNNTRNSVSQAQLSPTGAAFESEMTAWLNSDDLQFNLNSNSFQSSMIISPCQRQMGFCAPNDLYTRHQPRPHEGNPLSHNEDFLRQ